jgi:hypothetical protein
LDYFYSSKSEIQGQDVWTASKCPTCCCCCSSSSCCCCTERACPTVAVQMPLYSTFWMKILDAQKQCTLDVLMLVEGCC